MGALSKLQYANPFSENWQPHQCEAGEMSFEMTIELIPRSQIALLRAELEGKGRAASLSV